MITTERLKRKEYLQAMLISLFSFQKAHNMKLPDWVLNGTTYEDMCKVSDYGMGWNFNTREKARLTGGLCWEGTLARVVIKQEGEEMVAFRFASNIQDR